MKDFRKSSGISIGVFQTRLQQMMAMTNPDLDSIAAGWLGMLLISTLFIDKSTRVNHNVLPFLYQTDAVGQYSWAAGILACLYRGLGEGTRTFPCIIQTDRELGLINALRRVFPTVQHRLCWVHIDRKCGEMALQLGRSTEIQQAFKNDVWSLMSSRSVASYDRRRRGMHARWHERVPDLMRYLENTWLVPYSQNIVRAWTDTTLHFGTRTTNRCVYSVPSPGDNTIRKMVPTLSSICA